MTWGILSEDGHIVRSASVFSVGDVDASSAPDVADFSANDFITWLLRAIGDLGTIVLGGAIAAWWLLGARQPYVWRLAFVAGAFAFIGTGAWMLQQIIEGGSGWLSTSMAWATAARLGLLGGAALAARSIPKAAAIMVLGAVGMLAIGGHVTGSIIGTAAKAAHLFAAIVWIGAAPAVLLTLRDRELDDTAALGVVRRFARAATVATVVLALAGTALTLVLTETFSGGLTMWLQILVVKAGLVIIALAGGSLGRSYLGREPRRSRFRWLFAFDAGILVAVALSRCRAVVGSAHSEPTRGRPRGSRHRRGHPALFGTRG